MKEYPKEDLEVMKKPWGRYVRYTLNRKSTVKIHTVNKGHVLSLQSHKSRDEMWVPLDEGFIITIEGKVTRARPGEIFFVPRGTKHRLSSTRERANLLEISFGDFDEEDIVRHEDEYGRAGPT